MKLLRLLRQYDSIKAAVILSALTVFLSGYCIRAAAVYAAYLRRPAEYLCTAADGFDRVLPLLAQNETVIGYSPQKSAVFTGKDRTLTVTELSAAYLSDCFGLAPDSHIIFANDAAWASIAGDRAGQSVQCRGTLDGMPFSAEIIRTERLPKEQPLAVTAVSAAELHDAAELRICMTNPDAAALAALGLHIGNPEALTAAEYESRLVLLRIRLGALAALLSGIAAAAFLKIYRQLSDEP